MKALGKTCESSKEQSETIETAEEIVRRKAIENDDFYIGLNGSNFNRGDPPYAAIFIDCTSEELSLLLARYGGKPSSVRRGVRTGATLWNITNAEPRRIKSLFEILPLLVGTKKLGYALDALAQELNVPISVFQPYFWKHHKDSWSWPDFRHWCKLHPHLGEE